MGNPESWKFWLVESRILVFRIHNSAQGIQNPTNDRNRAFKKPSHSFQISKFFRRVIPLDPL